MLSKPWYLEKLYSIRTILLGEKMCLSIIIIKVLFRSYIVNLKFYLPEKKMWYKNTIVVFVIV